MSTRSIRPPAVAGTFYPGEAAVLRDTVESLLARAQPAPGYPDDAPTALVAPHAGYIYSGPTAALAYRILMPYADRIHRVVLLGPTHRVAIHGMALPGVDAVRTPLGDMQVDPYLVELALSVPGVAVRQDVHAEEHSLEVQLPFLQCVLGPYVPILPVAVGEAGADDVADLLDIVADEDDTLLVVSSDLSHYMSDQQARRKDAVTIARILDRDGPLDPYEACGARPVSGLISWSLRRDLTAHLLGSANSSAAGGDVSRVVGYAALGFWPTAEESNGRDAAVTHTAVREPTGEEPAAPEPAGGTGTAEGESS